MFPKKSGGKKKMIPVLLALILSALSVLAGATNEIHIDALSAGGRIYTNATITRANPAYAVVNYQEGIVQIPMSDMPADYQAQFGYTPEKAAQFLDEEKQNQKKRLATLRAQQAASQALAGTNQLVRITAVADDSTFGGIPPCSADGISDVILVKNLPASIKQFLTGYRQLKADIAAAKQQLDRLKAAEPPPAKTAVQTGMGKKTFIGNGAGYVKVGPPQNDNTATAAKQDAKDRLKALNAELDQKTAQLDRNTTIIAHPSGETFGGKPIWICIGMPAAPAR